MRSSHTSPLASRTYYPQNRSMLFILGYINGLAATLISSTAVSRIQRGVALELGNVSFLIPLMISLLLFPGFGRLVRPQEVATLNSLDKLQRLTCIEVANLAIRSHRPQPTI